MPKSGPVCPEPSCSSPASCPGGCKAREGKPFNPKPGDPGSLGKFTHEGREIVAQVWSAAPAQPEHGTYGRRIRAYWLVSDGVAYLVNRKGVVCGVTA